MTNTATQETKTNSESSLYSNNEKPKAIFLMGAEVFDRVYSDDLREQIASRVDIECKVYTPEDIASDYSLLEDVEVIFSSWGMAKMDEKFLDSAPNLKAVFYAAGSVKYFVTDAFWQRDIVLSSAYSANAVPVAEFTLAQILFCLKRQFYYNNKLKKERGFKPSACTIPGAYGSDVGIISLGEISRKVIDLLRPFDINIHVQSGYLTEEMAKQMGVIKAETIDDIFTNCDVVSLHSPHNAKTTGMIRGSHFKQMKYGASFINTARGAVVNEAEMIEVLKDRPDVIAMLDVFDPEPPLESSELYDLPNTFLTPHIAGSMGRECQRMAEYMLNEFDRYTDGKPLKFPITTENIAYLA